LRGRIDGVFEGLLRGWAWNPARPGHAMVVSLRIDGEPVAALTASLPRADLEQAGMGDGHHGFECALPLRFQDGAAHEIALETWWYDELVRLDLATPHIPRRLHMLRGRLEGIARGRLRGWAWDQARPEVPVALELWHEDRVLARVLADRHRVELAHGGIGGGAHGFELALAGLAPEEAELELRCAPEFGGWSLGRVTVPGAATPGGPMPAHHFRDEARQAEARQDPAAAARILEHGLRLHPEDFELLVLRARVLLAMQQWEPAEAAARQALALRPDHPRPTVLLARLAGLLERHAEAAAHWSRIGPEDRAWRERLARRPQHLAAQGRAAEVLSELALAARHRPEDAALAKALADAAGALGAEGAARAHLRRVLELAPGDQAAALRLASLDRRLAGAGTDALASPLVNPALRTWRGPVRGVVEGEALVAPGLVLRGAALGFAAAAPREQGPGELPGYGLRLEVAEGGAEAEFALEAAPLPRPALRMALELEGEAEMAVALLLRRDGQPDRRLLEFRSGRRPRLLRFDLPPVRQGALVLWMEGPGALVVRPPRPLFRLEAVRATSRGFEAPELAGRLVPPPPAPRAERLAETGLPFTTIEIAAPPSAMTETLRAVLDATAPFECVLAEGESKVADPRIRILPAGAAPAEGWVAQVKAPPEGGPGWLSALHREAAAEGAASAPGVRLEWRAPGSSSPAPGPALPH